MGLQAAGAPPVSFVEGHSAAVGSWALHAGLPDHAGVAPAPKGCWDALQVAMGQPSSCVSVERCPHAQSSALCKRSNILAVAGAHE